MTTQRRWLKSAIAASADPLPTLPWQRRAIVLPASSVDEPPAVIRPVSQPALRIKATG